MNDKQLRVLASAGLAVESSVWQGWALLKDRAPVSARAEIVA